jgi:hypothetical protein
VKPTGVVGEEPDVARSREFAAAGDGADLREPRAGDDVLGIESEDDDRELEARPGAGGSHEGEGGVPVVPPPANVAELTEARTHRLPKGREGDVLLVHDADRVALDESLRQLSANLHVLVTDVRDGGGDGDVWAGRPISAEEFARRHEGLFAVHGEGGFNIGFDLNRVQGEVCKCDRTPVMVVDDSVLVSVVVELERRGLTVVTATARELGDWRPKKKGFVAGVRTFFDRFSRQNGKEWWRGIRLDPARTSDSTVPPPVGAEGPIPPQPAAPRARPLPSISPPPTGAAEPAPAPDQRTVATLMANLRDRFTAVLDYMTDGGWSGQQSPCRPPVIARPDGSPPAPDSPEPDDPALARYDSWPGKSPKR